MSPTRTGVQLHPVTTTVPLAVPINPLPFAVVDFRPRRDPPKRRDRGGARVEPEKAHGAALT